MKTWSHKDEWKMPGKGFLVVVSRHSVETTPSDAYDNCGTNRWAVYAYIYPTHPRFEKFVGSDMWQVAATELPLHSGPSFLRFHLDENGNKTSVQIGADYNHLHDDEFTYFETKEDAYQVFNDAEKLHEFLEQSL